MSWTARFVAVLALALTATPVFGKLKIVTTTPDFASLARQIGGDRVEVHSVMKGPENMHNVLTTPTEMVRLNEADLFVHSGLDAEPWRDNLVKGARNPKLLDGRPASVDMSSGIPLKEVPVGMVDRAEGDIHLFGNPHYALNLLAGQRMVATLTKALVTADPAGADLYIANAKKLVNEFADLARELRKQMAPYAGVKVVTFHRAWAYFSDLVPVQIVGQIEPKPGVTPSPSQVQELIQRMKTEGVKIVIVETYNDDRLAARIAEAAGAQLLRLPDHVNGVPEVTSYQDLFRYNVGRIIDAAKAAGIPPKAEPAK
jgi:zinc/manganese transport system substrate-binding protein